MKVKIKKLHPSAVIPKYAKSGDAGLDLVVTTIKDEAYQVTYGFGIAVEIPEGYVGLVFPRSSIKKTDMVLSNSVGVIDSGYRGEIMATFKKLAGTVSQKYFVGERAAQLLIIPYPQVEFEEAETLSDSDRGTGGFGSTGN